MTAAERRAELVELLQWWLCAPCGRDNPFPGGRRSPLIEDEGDMRETCAILAARHPPFNGEGLGFDIPGTGDWPSIIIVGPGGRATGAAAIEIFFGLPIAVAEHMVAQIPTAELVAEIVRLDGAVQTDGRMRVQ